MILIPGLTFAGEIFKAQIEYFSRNYRVIAIDPRGQGNSTKTVDGNDYITHGQDLYALINALGIEEVILIGWSTGNFDIWSYLQQFGKDKVKAVITIDMSPLPLSQNPSWWTEGTIEEISAVATQFLRNPKGTRDFFRDYAAGIMIQHAMSDDEIEYLLDISCRTPYWICKALFCDVIFSNFLETAREAGEKLPCMMFIAEHWADIAEPFVESQLPGYKNHVMGGHLMFYEYPEEWNAVVDSFLKQL